MTKRAVIYARVSGDDTRKQGRNLEGQLQMCREHALAQGWNVVAELAEDDRGASGAEFDLPQLSRALEMAREGAFDVLIVREIDRFARRLAKQLLVEEEFNRTGVTLEYVLGDYADTPEGNLMKHVKATIAEYEREKINERMVRGRRQKVKSGSVIVYDRPPYGYRALTHEDGRQVLIIDKDEASVVELIFTWFTEGDGNVGPMSLRAIAKRLTELGVPTYTQSRKKEPIPTGRTREGRWSSTSVHDMLTKETYIGVWRYGKTTRKDGKFVKLSEPSDVHTEVPAIVTRQTWELAQKRFEENKRNARRNTKYDYLVGRRVLCGTCGGRMHGRSSSKSTKVYTYYECNARRSPDQYDHACHAPRFRCDQVDAAVWQWLHSVLVDPDALALGLHMQRTEAEKQLKPIRQQVAMLDQRIVKLRTQDERLLDLYLEGEIDKAQWSQRRDRLSTKLASLTEQRDGLQRRMTEHHATDEQIRGIRQFAREISSGIETIGDDFEARRHIVDTFDVQVTLGHDDDGDKAVYASCSIGSPELCIVSEDTHCRHWPENVSYWA